MKKVLGLSTLALAGVLTFTGCAISEEDGKAWAKENGYVDSKSHIGKYEFEYIDYDGEKYTCDSNDLPTEIQGLCSVFGSNDDIAVTERRIKLVPDSSPSADENNYYYVLGVDGKVYLKNDVEDGYYYDDAIKFEDGKMILGNDESKVILKRK